ncbi:MAG TPA: FHA domain-containing protein [Anaerolineaceae bacterium]|nr:FHA domain-containing protein [Anaerolineaceae bacterium]
MTAAAILVLRIVLALLLYAFLAVCLITIWRELRLHSRLLENRRAPRITLYLSEEGEDLKRIFESQEIVIGRDLTCDYPIGDETVSARHAILRYHHNQWWVEDLQSTNGAFLNDERIITPTVIISGDQLRCGAARLSVQIDIPNP